MERGKRVQLKLLEIAKEIVDFTFTMWPYSALGMVVGHISADKLILFAYIIPVMVISYRHGRMRSQIEILKPIADATISLYREAAGEEIKKAKKHEDKKA